MRIALVGGTGFIGQAVMAQLHQSGYYVRLIARHAPSPALPPRIEFIAADTADPTSLQTAFNGCDVVVHLVAILAEREHSFQQVIHQGALNTAKAAKQAHVKHVVYVSALGASLQSPSRYAQAKAQAENAIRSVYPHASIIRPGLVLGQGGGFCAQIDQLTRFSPFMLLPGYGNSLFQPVSLQKLAQTIAQACTEPSFKGCTLNLADTPVLTFRQLAKSELTLLKRKRLFIPLPWAITHLVAHTITWLDTLTHHRLIPSWLILTPDQLTLLKIPNTLPKN